jgi:hypothetical protein
MAVEVTRRGESKDERGTFSTSLSPARWVKIATGADTLCRVRVQSPATASARSAGRPRSTISTTAPYVHRRHCGLACSTGWPSPRIGNESPTERSSGRPSPRRGPARPPSARRRCWNRCETRPPTVPAHRVGSAAPPTRASSRSTPGSSARASQPRGYFLNEQAGLLADGLPFPASSPPPASGRRVTRVAQPCRPSHVARRGCGGRHRVPRLGRGGSRSM